MTTEIRYRRDFRGEPVRVVVWNSEEPGQEAQFAMELVRTWGLVAGKVEGREDRAGRAVVENMTVDETVARAFDLAAATYKAMRERGLMLAIAPYEEALEKAREEGERN